MTKNLNPNIAVNYLCHSMQFLLPFSSFCQELMASPQITKCKNWSGLFMARFPGSLHATLSFVKISMCLYGKRVYMGSRAGLVADMSRSHMNTRHPDRNVLDKIASLLQHSSQMAWPFSCMYVHLRSMRIIAFMIVEKLQKLCIHKAATAASNFAMI